MCSSKTFLTIQARFFSALMCLFTANGTVLQAATYHSHRHMAYSGAPGLCQLMDAAQGHTRPLLDTTPGGSVGNAIAVTAATGVVDDAEAHSYVAVAAVAPTTNQQTRGPLSSKVPPCFCPPQGRCQVLPGAGHWMPVALRK